MCPRILQLLPCVQNENPFVRDMALHCLGLACLLDISNARNHLLLFLQVCVCDCVCVCACVRVHVCACAYVHMCMYVCEWDYTV